MLKSIRSAAKGFTLIEIVVALAILVLFSGFTLTTISSIQQAKMRDFAQTIKSEFELTRDFAKTHGGEAAFSIAKVDGGVMISRTGKNLTTEEYFLKDANLAVFYVETGDNTEYELGVTDSEEVHPTKTLRMEFSQTDGAIIGPQMLDYIIISNGSKNYKFMIKQSTGMMYYDYEIDEDAWEGNVKNENSNIVVQLPTFISQGEFVDTVTLTYTGKSLQPELNYDARYVKISGIYREKDKNEDKDGVLKDGYVIIFSLKDPHSTEWVGGSKEPKTLIWRIE